MNTAPSNLLSFPETMELPDRQRHFRDQLVSTGWLLQSKSHGINPLGPDSNAVIDGLLRAMSQLARTQKANSVPAKKMLALNFPPITRTEVLERTDYVASFPQLTGIVNTFRGEKKDHAQVLAAHASGADWQSSFTDSDYALVPAVCHPLYDHLAGSVVDGTSYELTGNCFRNEPSEDPMRMVSFRMREYVKLGSESESLDHRELWLKLALEFLAELGLDVFTDIANDPFFGRAGKLLAAGQRGAELKFEILAEVYPGEPTAIASGNCHQDHFGQNFSITIADGSVAHSACFGFGIERIMLALVAKHGFDLSAWPQEILAGLDIEISA